MSTFKMGFKNLFVFTALVLVCKVYGQATRVEYITQPSSSSIATTVQTPPQLVVPAIIKPVITPYDSYYQESVPCVPSYNGFNGYNSYVPSCPQPMPPIIIDDDDDDNWHHLLYFLIFAMRNKRNCGAGNCGGYNGGYNGGCGCGGGCNGGCSGFNGGYNNGCGCGGNCGGNCGFDNFNFGGYSNNNCGCNAGSGVNYVPYPIPYPLSGPYPYSFPGYTDNSNSCNEEPYQCGQGPNEINLIIRTDGSCTC